MKVTELATLIDGRHTNGAGADNDVICGYSCDLLSWVMANGQAGCGWITVQTHMNVVAVASLHDMACIILPEGVEMEAPSLQKAADEGIAVITSPMPAFRICCIMGEHGITPAGR